MKTENNLTQEEKDYIIKYGGLTHRLSLSTDPSDTDKLIRYYELLNKYNGLSPLKEQGERRYEIKPVGQLDDQIELLKKDFENNDRPLFNNPMYLAGVHDGMYHLKANIIELDINDFSISMQDVERAFCFGYITNPTNNCLDNVEMMRRWETFKSEYLNHKILE